MSEIFKSIKTGLEEAIEFSKGTEIGARIFTPQQIDIQKLRKRLGMTQEKFANSFGISLGTLRHWERGDRKPQGPALVLLNLVSKEPETVLKLLYN